MTVINIITYIGGFRQIQYQQASWESAQEECSIVADKIREVCINA